MKGAVLITGGGSGIGAACAEAFLRSGRPVVIVGRTARRLRETARRIAAAAPAWRLLLALPGDAGEEAFARRAFAAARRRFGAVDILVNNAAVLVNKPFAALSAADWDATMRTNLRGPFLFSREFLRQFARPSHTARKCRLRTPLESGRRAIVNVGSLGGVSGTAKFPGLAAYTVSKYGIAGLAAALAAEARALGAAVFCVAPGAVNTDMLRRAAPGLRSGAADPADIARVVVELAESPSADLLSGATIPLDTNP